MKKGKKHNIKRAALDLDRLKYLSETELVDITGGYVNGDGGSGDPLPRTKVGGNSYWN